MHDAKPNSVTTLFEQGGGLSNTLSHFELRPGQVALVQAIESALDRRTHLVAEAGTGIGKTFSYLLPTLVGQKKVFVSTATKHLQEQIFFKDLPIIEKVLGRKVAACLLKGRSNYFCHYRFHEFFQSAFALNRKQTRKANNVRDWSEKTLTGDLGEIAEFTVDDIGFQRRITSTSDNCLGGECPYFDDCFVQKAREKAKKSEVVIVNHALLMADIVLKDIGFAEILPDVDVVIIDEAHHLPKIATQAFAEQITGGQLVELVRDARHVYREDAGDVDDFEAVMTTLRNAVQAFGDALSGVGNGSERPLSELKQMPQAYRAFQQLMQAYKPFLHGLEALAERSSDLQHLYERSATMAARIKHIFTPPKAVSPSATPHSAIPANTTNTTTHLAHFESRDRPEQHRPDGSSVAPAVSASPAVASVALLAWEDETFRVSRLPIHLGNRFYQAMQYYADSWLFVSATLAMNESFDFFINALGLPGNIETAIVQSPFDYPKHAVVHIPPRLPFPGRDDFVASLVDHVLPILKKTQGRAFLLFTSYRNLYAAAAQLENSDFSLFVQGEMPKSQLIDAFIKSDNAVLLGTISFWEGVDISGDRLCCVVIDKIPFPSPGDPIVAEQTRYLAQQGKNAFALYALPQAATLLKQGAGRLIRSQRDKGVLIIGDTRMLYKSYGKQLLAALPPATFVDGQGLQDFIEREL